MGGPKAYVSPDFCFGVGLAGDLPAIHYQRVKTFPFMGEVEGVEHFLPANV
jgi:hypothetical protein